MRNLTSLLSLMYIVIKATLIVFVFKWITVQLSWANTNEERILFVGDSHSVGPFGSKLNSLLRTIPNAKVETHAAVGAIAEWFINGGRTPTNGDFIHLMENNKGVYCATRRDIERAQNAGRSIPGPACSGRRTAQMQKLLDKVNPTLVIIELSGNYEHSSDTYALNDMENMMELIKDKKAKCLWVTAPAPKVVTPRRLPRLVNLTREAVSSYCTVFESDKVTHYPASRLRVDGIHYSFSEGIPVANEWARLVFKKVEEML